MKFLLLIIIGLVGFFAVYPKHVSSPISVPQTVLPQVTPDPFEDLTIPALRTRSYSSQMGELKQISKNANFTSFLTSYTADDLHINGLLTQPTGKAPEGGWPVIVFVHGYIPPSLYKTTERYVEYVNFLARSGFVVFKIDLRGHGNSEGDPGGAYYSGDYVIDTLSAIQAVQSLPFVNKDRVGLWGHSMAGNITLRTLAAKPDIKATAIWAGAGYTYTDLLDYKIQDNSYRPPQDQSRQSARRKELADRHGPFDPNDSFWKLVPPTNYLGDIRGAIGLYHAIDDTVVKVDYSRNLNKLLDATTIIHELHEYPSGGHNISGASFTKAMQTTVEFYKKNL
ncbi:MAG: alpha/beta fold hydrolase [Candidatus Woesebacteria bacterium]